MKKVYFLETESKRNTEEVVSISLKAHIKRFDNLNDIISYLFENANFIDSYKIYEAKYFKDQEDGMCTEFKQESVNLRGTESISIFS